MSLEFSQGATFIMVMPGDGASTEFDRLEVVALTLEGKQATVAIARDNKTYVTAHAYPDDAVNRMIDGGD
jgi:imidazolonepropionase-like amidohydrolase